MEPDPEFPVLAASAMEATMGKSDDLRKNAENCIELADTADTVQKKMRYVRMAKSWNSLADTQSWLDGEHPDKPKESPDFGP